MGEIIPFPVLKINFENIGTNKKYVVKEVFFIRSLEVGEIIPFPVWRIPFPDWIIPFPILEINF